MERKEKILSYIKSSGYVPLKIGELMAVLCVPVEDETEFAALLDELVGEGKIIKTKRGRFESSRGGRVVCGTLSCSAHGFYAFLTPDDEGEKDVYIKGEYLAGALHGDYVSAVIDCEDSQNGRADGHVLKILKHANENIFGVIKKKKKDYYEIRPDSPKIYSNVAVAEENLAGAELGERVVVRITDFSASHPTGVVIKRLGSADDLKSNIEAILFLENIQSNFEQETISEAEQTPAEVSDKELEGRLDLRDKLIFTIDGDDARDFDDAVSLEILKNGRRRLGVHIADVTHYVKPGSALDREAFERGTSIYLPDRVIPMLPKKLSNGICSLNPDVDRLTLSVFMEFSKSGRLMAHELHKSVIHSCERMTYNNVTKLLTNPTPELTTRYKRLLPTIKRMENLAMTLREKRMERGSIDFDFPESKITVGADGLPTNIVREKTGISNKIIEEFMLAANETVAEYAFWSEIPFVYRVHEPPTTENMRDFSRFVSAFGLGIKEKFSDSEPIHPKALQQVLSAASGMEEEHMISVYALRSLMKAEYKPENLGHFGLAAKYYCHFTSPIRRYPDLAIHRILKAFISGKNVENYSAFAAEAAKHSSDAERSAQSVEREVCDLMKTYYMSKYIGYIYEAKISSVTDFGIFAELENTVEGMIRPENLKDDFYEFDSEKRIFTGRRGGKVYKIGDAIEIAVARCDLLTRCIEFIPAENATMADIDALQKKAFKKRRETDKKIKAFSGRKQRRRKKRRR